MGIKVGGLIMGWIPEYPCEPYAVRVARTVTRGVHVYTYSVVVGPTPFVL